MRKTALIVETRILPGWNEIITKNHLQHLGSEWGLIIVHGTNNEGYVKQNSPSFAKFINCEMPNMNTEAYNNLMTSEAFWNKIDAEKVLIIQADSKILRNGINDFMKWDYIGAPWKFQEHGGNGGLSLRTVRVLINVIRAVPGYNSGTHGNEDVYFSNALANNPVLGVLAPRSACSEFSCESIFELGTFGCHAIEKYFDRDQIKQVYTQYDNGVPDKKKAGKDVTPAVVKVDKEEPKTNDATSVETEKKEEQPQEDILKENDFINQKTENKMEYSSIESAFHQLCSQPSDINEHLPTLKAHAEECDHITEMGVREGLSTVAFLASKPGRLKSYDIDYKPQIENLRRLAFDAGIKFEYTLADVLETEIEETDLLFIDTLHTYTQLSKELLLHADRVRKYIILHDTETYALTPEPADWQTKSIMRNYVQNDQGLRPAINEFIRNKADWQVDKMHHNNNGLTILKRVK